MVSGIPVVIRRKFKASEFWKDCIKYKVTVSNPNNACMHSLLLCSFLNQGAQYMGETCRYLLKQPPSPEENTHGLRMMFGNGLRSEIWTEFKDRFNIPLILELYGATEGNANICKL